MRSREAVDRRRRWTPGGLLISVSLLLALPQLGSNAQAAADGGQPSESEVQRALAAVKADPNLATERKRRVPSFADGKLDDRSARPPTITWLRDLFRWLGETSRALLWVVGALFVMFLVRMLIGLVRKVNPRPATVVAAAPTHVRDLDIRPESLPEHIGAAALQLWIEQQPRAALALLYRGLLSRLVHVHGIAIRESTTEAGCIELARQLPAPLPGCVQQLVRCWQRAVYGGMQPADAEFQSLCNDFDAAFAAPARQAT